METTRDKSDKEKFKMDYLIHYNQNHNPKNGQFYFGDGDGDGQLNERERRRVEEKDNKWAKKNYDSIVNKAYKPVRKDIDHYLRKELNPKYRRELSEGRITKSYMNEYNQRLASMMNMHVDGISAPSGRVIKFIAKRGEIGVHMALADPEYDMSAFRRGVYGSGRIAYRQTHVNMA